MTLPELFVMRHGETEWNLAGRWQGDRDSPLTTKGEAQAREMGAMLRRLGVTAQSHRLYSSPMTRARRTALLAGGDDWPIIEDARLREISVGDWTGRSRDEIRLETDLPEDAHFMDFYARAPEGEPFEEVMSRVQRFLRSLDGPSVIVTHGITSRFLRTAAMGWGLDRVLELPGGQGVIHHVANNQHAELQPE
ncbi:MAG: histidine phosphatase family protein [Flavimaricola sp.]|nr:histidine phosphatase family protein [Flavimaricola sp.]